MQEKEINDAIRHNLNTIYSLAKKDIRDKTPYQIVLNDLSTLLEVPIAPFDNGLTNFLSNQMNVLKQRIENVTEDNATKVNFWISYMYWAAWTQFYNDGLGHLTDFSIDRTYTKFNVNIRLSVQKREFETKEMHEKRKEKHKEWIKENNLEVIEDDNNHLLADTDYNRTFIKNYVEKFCMPRNIEIKTRGNAIKSITVYVIKKDSFSFYKNEYKEKKEFDINLSDLDIEKIIKDATEWYQAYDMCEKYGDSNEPSVLKLKETAKRLSYSIYFQLCERCSVSNEITKAYEKYNLSDRNENLKARETEEEIGATYDFKEVMDMIKSTHYALEEYLQKKYSLYLDSFLAGERSFITLKFDMNKFYIASECMDKITEDDEDYVDVKNVRDNLDLYEYIDYEEYYIKACDENIKFFEKILSEELFAEVVEINMDYRKSKRCISSIKLCVKDLSKLILMFKKDESL